MNLKERRVELLAPAGNREGFYGAVCAGADAVYLGGDKYGARAYADNFTAKELVECIRYAHIRSRKVYLTVNTLVKEAEMAELYEYLCPFYEAGLDGVIVQDIGVLAFIREQFPDMELHASTQMTITGRYGAQLVKDMGVCRIVPARELSLSEITDIKENTGLAIETFIHGAMCYSYSGQCLFSSILGGRSGNRGRCAQPCRLPFTVHCGKETTEECYPLSLKDMCTIEHIPDLIAAGIDSFKIEGRMKKPEYTAGVTAIYRKYIDCYYNHEAFFVEEEDLRALSKLYIRSERQDGYYYKQNGADMVTLQSPAYNGSDETLLQQIREKYLLTRPAIPLQIMAGFPVGEKPWITLVCGDTSVYVTAQEAVEKAVKQPVTRENIAKQLGKLGDTFFMADQIDISMDEEVFYPLKSINELRRQAVAALEDALIADNHFPVHRQVPPPLPWSMTVPKTTAPQRNMALPKTITPQIQEFSVSVATKEQLGAYKQWYEKHSEVPVSRLYLNANLLLEDKGLLSDRKQYPKIILTMPYILRKKDYADMQDILDLANAHNTIIKGIQVRSLEGLGFLLGQGYQGEIYTDAGFYVWNQRTLQEWQPYLSGFCLPYELKQGECRALMQCGIPAERIVYGRIPMMITANCVAKTTRGCKKQAVQAAQTARLTDRFRKEFPVALECRQCMNIIYNSVPLSLHGKLHKWQNQVTYGLYFTIENQQETCAVLDYFLLQMPRTEGNQLKQNQIQPPFGEYTTGHEKRGVE